MHNYEILHLFSVRPKMASMLLRNARAGAASALVLHGNQSLSALGAKAPQASS